MLCTKILINNKYNPNGFDIHYTHKDTDYIYDPNGFNIGGFHKDTRSKYDSNGFDINGLHKDTRSKYDFNGFDINGKHKDKIKTSEAKSFKDQKGKGYVDLPIFLSKLNINIAEPSSLARSSKELVSNVKQLVKKLYGNKQITKQVYNNLIKAITYK